jgi:hypothetical protein
MAAKATPESNSYSEDFESESTDSLIAIFSSLNDLH